MIDTAWQKIVGSVDVSGGHGTCATVEIVSDTSPTGRVCINQSDFDPATMTLYVEKK